MKGTAIKQFFDEKYPLDTAYEWDNVGLQIGTLNKTITGVLITLDVTKDVVSEAIKNHCNLIIAHHPLIFSPLKKVTTDAYKGQLIAMLIKEDIAVYVSHTNYDLGNTGMNQVLADRIGLENQTILEMVSETHGIGRIGTILPMPLEKAVNVIKEALMIDTARLITNTSEKLIETVAISGGSGASHMMAAKMQGADLYITGDVSYHRAHDMLQIGLTALDIGHYAEHHFASALKAELEHFGITVPIHISDLNLDPFVFV